MEDVVNICQYDIRFVKGRQLQLRENFNGLLVWTPASSMDRQTKASCCFSCLP